MNQPNPLLPQGLLPNHSRGKSTVRIAVLTIVAIHAVFFAGLLMQGCKRDDPNKLSSTTNASDLSSQLSDLARLDTNYYQPLPPEPIPPTTVAPTTPATPSNGYQAVTPSTPVAAPPIQATEPPPATGPAETKEYTIARNDTLVKIAKAHHVTVGDVTRANPGIDPRRLIPGKKIQVPIAPRTAANGATTGAGAEGLGFAEPSKPASDTGAKPGIHQVKAGENLTKIAKQHGVTIKALRTANGLRTDRLHVGQKLKLPASSSSTGAATTPSEPSAIPSRPTTTLSATNPAGNTTVR
ncbi:MAG: LysM peptidoglycan-binding domain-containing protein [Verrucomicrobiales bacterium]|nr:LysM peptidoglycan-binding domain-containing protein [Verrucomicrobiales bacterium]